jgi:ATP-binding protein involved in chromosome partitioning
VSFRSYAEVAGDDRSRLLDQVIAQRARVARRLAHVGGVVAIMSGKGGVGKSWLTASLALACARRLTSVGVVDGDLKGPTIAQLLHASGPLDVTDDGVHPALGDHGIAVMSSDLLIEDGRPLAWKEPSGDAFIWRGVLETNALREFLGDVVWGARELLLVDLPPGSDRIPDLAQLVPPASLRGAIAVTIPSDESRRSVERALHAAREANVPILGVVENMSGYRCGTCGDTRPLFRGDAGARLAAQFDVPLLATIPFAQDAMLGENLPVELLEAVDPRPPTPDPR